MIKKCLIICAGILISMSAFSFESIFIRNDGIYIQETNNVITLSHPWWETGNYTSNVVARFRAQDAWRANRYGDRTDAWGIKQAQPRYSGITTNTVHWMRAHNDMSEGTPYLTFTGWHRYGWIRLFWRESLTEGKWLNIASTSTQHYGVHNFKVYFHPKSKTTQKIINANTGFFRMSNGFYTTPWDKTTLPTSRIFKIDVSKLK